MRTISVIVVAARLLAGCGTARQRAAGGGTGPVHRLGRGAGARRLRLSTGDGGRSCVRRRLGGAVHEARSPVRQGHAVREPRHVAERPVEDRQARRRGRRPVGGRPAQGRAAHGQGRQRRAGVGHRHASTTRTRTAAPPSIRRCATPSASTRCRRRAAAKLLNLDAGDADYAEMVQNGWAVLYVGTATFKGGTSCTSTDASYDFSAAADARSNFKLGFKSPTTLRQLPEPRQRSGQGARRRGAPARRAGEGERRPTIAQVTVHTDHPFWESFDARLARALRSARRAGQEAGGRQLPR